MRLTIEMFTMVIAITLSAILFASIISSSNQIYQARDYYNVVANRIEDSNYNDKVIKQCEGEAKEKGYILDVKDVTLNGDNPSKYIKLSYSIEYPIFGMFKNRFDKEAQIKGYAR